MYVENNKHIDVRTYRISNRKSNEFPNLDFSSLLKSCSKSLEQKLGVNIQLPNLEDNISKLFEFRELFNLDDSKLSEFGELSNLEDDDSKLPMFNERSEDLGKYCSLCGSLIEKDGSCPICVVPIFIYGSNCHVSQGDNTHSISSSGSASSISASKSTE